MARSLPIRVASFMSGSVEISIKTEPHCNADRHLFAMCAVRLGEEARMIHPISVVNKTMILVFSLGTPAASRSLLLLEAGVVGAAWVLGAVRSGRGMW